MTMARDRSRYPDLSDERWRTTIIRDIDEIDTRQGSTEEDIVEIKELVRWVQRTLILLLIGIIGAGVSVWIRW